MKNVFRKESDGSYTLDLYFRLAYYSHFCLMEGLNFKTGIFREKIMILAFYLFTLRNSVFHIHEE